MRNKALVVLLAVLVVVQTATCAALWLRPGGGNAGSTVQLAAIRSELATLNARLETDSEKASEVQTAFLGLITGLHAAMGESLTSASHEARQANLVTNIQTVRSQLLLYKVQHLEAYPEGDADIVVAQLTQYTNAEGETSTTADDDHPFGPYLQSIPENPYTDSRALRVVSDPSAEFTPPDNDTDTGWYYNSATGEFRADLTDDRFADNGHTPLNEL